MFSVTLWDCLATGEPPTGRAPLAPGCTETRLAHAEG
nr:MAG TPA: hypothetical protein [Caudoviricetes sp.]